MRPLLLTVNRSTPADDLQMFYVEPPLAFRDWAMRLSCWLYMNRIVPSLWPDLEYSYH